MAGISGLKGSNCNHEDDLLSLEDWLRRLKVEYDIFLNGHRKKPPDDLKSRVEKLIKRLSEAQNMNVSQRFRFNTLVTRFYVHRDLWRRIIQAREEGGAEPAADPSPPPSQFPSRVRIAIQNPEAEEEKVHMLYDTLLGMRDENNQPTPTFSYKQFLEYIAKQTRDIRGRYGCSKVVFSVTVYENAVRFTATAEDARRGLFGESGTLAGRFMNNPG